MRMKRIVKEEKNDKEDKNSIQIRFMFLKRITIN